jgi:hypothetical protein
MLEKPQGEVNLREVYHNPRRVPAVLGALCIAMYHCQPVYVEVNLRAYQADTKQDTRDSMRRCYMRMHP